MDKNLNIQDSVKKLKAQFNLRINEFAIIVDPSHQELYLVKNKEVVKTYGISTSKNGLGNNIGSGKTPTGTHRIKEKIGEGLEVGTILKGRKNTFHKAEIFKEQIASLQDYVTTRIMWLEGQEENLNCEINEDSRERYIYIHGTPEEGFIGKPVSNGCIRMRNNDIIELFDLVSLNTLVEIQNKIP